jgi:hypothetical protein
MNGFIKLHRRFLKWEWYNDINARILFLHCLLRANHEPTTWQGQEIKRGQFITSLSNLAKEVGLSVQQVRTALDKLKITHEITHETTRHNSIISINNWDKWQANQHTEQHQNNNRQEIKEEKNIKEEEEQNAHEKNSSSDSRLNLNEWFGEYQNVHLTSSQYGQLLSMIAHKQFLDELINDLSENIARKKEDSPPYDEKYPHMHFVIIKKYWKFRQQNPHKFKKETAKPQADNKAQRLEEMRKAHEQLKAERGY